MEINVSTSGKRNFKLYIIGLLLCYVLSLIVFGGGFVAGASWSFNIAAFGALICWPFIALPHAGFQFVLGFIVKRFWTWGRSHQTVILNLPISILILLAGLNAWREPEYAFKHFLADPIPQSIRIVQFGREQAIGEHMRLTLVFAIQTNDLADILQHGGFEHVPTNGNDRVGPTSEMWTWQFCRGIKIDHAVPRQVYVSTNDSGRHLLIGSNLAEVIFFYAKPN